MSSGTLILHRFNGEEEFSIQTAIISHYYDDEDRQYVISFEIETGEPLKTLPDTVSLRAHPSFELNLRANKSPQLLLAPGRTFKIPHGDDKNTGESLTNFCYVEHEPTDRKTALSELVITSHLPHNPVSPCFQQTAEQSSAWHSEILTAIKTAKYYASSKSATVPPRHKSKT